MRGATLRFVDCDPNGNLSLEDLKQLINQKTIAIIAVDYAGHSCDLFALKNICSEHKIYLLEDSAQALGSTIKSQPLGTIGTMGCYSFHETKNVGCGEGGALVINDENFLDRAYILREKGTNRKKFFQGLVDKYNWVDIGSSYLCSDLNAAVLLPQLKSFSHIQEKRKFIWENYASELSALCVKFGVDWIKKPHFNSSNYHLFALLLPNPILRQKFIEDMKGYGIVTPFHYLPLHTSPIAKLYSPDTARHLPNTERLSSTLVRLPIFYNMSEDQLTFVIEKTKNWIQTEIS